MNNNEILEMMLSLSGQDFTEVAERAEDFEYEGVKVTLVDSYGGEGDGDTYYRVYKLINEEDSKDTIFVKFDGYYSSYNGTDWDNEECFKVEPEEVTVIEYIAVENG